MKPIGILTTLLAAGLLASTLQAAQDGWMLPERRLPLPAGASSELQAALAKMQPPDVKLAKSLTPAGETDWKKLEEAGAGAREDNVRALARKLGVKVEEGSIAGVPVHRLTPARIAPGHSTHLLVYVHGGAYVFNGGYAGITEGLIIASRIGIPVLSIDYRMPPAHPFPAALEDVIAVWRELLKQRPAVSMAMGGTSAGGGLILATGHRLKALGLELPGMLYAGTPWSDLTRTGDSYFTNEGVDHLLVTWPGILEASAKLYANGRDLKEPLLSPVYGSFDSFPPTFLLTGTRDLFLSNTVRVHQKLRAAGVEADLNVFEGFSHGDYLGLTETPESVQAYRELGRFLGRHLK